MKDGLKAARQALRRKVHGVGPAKVFCVGMHKTGTSSLHTALHCLGYRVAKPYRYNRPFSEAEAIGDMIARVRHHDAFQDSPWFKYYEMFAHAFPDAKFILTTREDASWFRSMERFFGNSENSMHTLIYGVPSIANHREQCLERYRAHNAAVRAFFSDQPDRLIEMDLARGDGWPKLTAFLGCRSPAVPFPHKNKARAAPARVQA